MISKQLSSYASIYIFFNLLTYFYIKSWYYYRIFVFVLYISLLLDTFLSIFHKITHLNCCSLQMFYAILVTWWWIESWLRWYFIQLCGKVGCYPFILSFVFAALNSRTESSPTRAIQTRTRRIKTFQVRCKMFLYSTNVDAWLHFTRVNKARKYAPERVNFSPVSPLVSSHSTDFNAIPDDHFEVVAFQHVIQCSPSQIVRSLNICKNCLYYTKIYKGKNYLNT